jgi:hypothetical protein
MLALIPATFDDCVGTWSRYEVSNVDGGIGASRLIASGKHNYGSAKGFIMRHARGSIHFQRLSFGRRQVVAEFRKLRA